MSPRDWAPLEEAHLRVTLAREQASNRAYAHRCPGVRETECYRRGLPPKSTFYTEADHLRARILHERAKYDPARCASPCRALRFQR